MQIRNQRVSLQEKIIVRRMLPVTGQILVKSGQVVQPMQTVARAELPRRYRIINVARQLDEPDIDMNKVMLKAPGDEVKANEAIAASKGALPFLQRTVRAPEAGYISTIGKGWVLLETERKTIELQAFINGQVSKIIPDKGVIIESFGALIEGACGFGGEAYGRLMRVVDFPYATLTPDVLHEGQEEAILLAGKTIDEETLREAEVQQVRGIIVGSIDYSLLNLDPPVKVRVVATEGFGDHPMSPYTFGTLSQLDNRGVSIRGQTPILTTTREKGPQTDPPIILGTPPHSKHQPPPDYQSPALTDIEEGHLVRVITGEMLGATGPIDSLPKEPQTLPSGLVVQGGYVKIEGQLHFVPLTNMQRLKQD